MKLIVVVLCFMLLNCIESSNVENDKRTSLRRVVRSTLLDLGHGHVNQIKFSIIRSCVENGFIDIEDELQESFTNLTTCIKEKKLLIEPKESYIKHMEDCSQGAIKKVRGCLIKEKRYFPDLLLNMAKSQIANIYDNQNIVSIYLPICLKTFNTPEVTSRYQKCLDVAKGANSSSVDIPNSVDMYCQRYLPATHCFPDILTSVCSQYPKIKKFAIDRLKASESPCNQIYV